MAVMGTGVGRGLWPLRGICRMERDVARGSYGDYAKWSGT